tara:strand:+ start:323 stop:2044 length:1722 start_codon:yes stop_codon:yes gene_type:complete
MSTNKKITDLPELTELNLADDDVLAIVDVSAGTTNKVQKSVLASALSGVSVVNATSPIAVNQTTGEVTVSISSTPSFGTVDLTADTSTGDTAAVGYTSAEGIIITGQGSSNDITLKNDADAVALKVPTGTTNVTVTGVASAASFTGSGAGLTAGSTPITTLDIDGGTDIGAAIVDADLFIIDDGATGTNRKTTASRLKTYIGAATGDVVGPASATDNTAVRFDSTTGKLIQGSGVTIDDSNNVGAASLTLTTDLAVAHGGTGVSTFTDGGILLGSGTGAITALAAMADGEMVVGDGTTDPVLESGATLRTSIGVGTGDSPTFAGLTLSADLSVANGGTGGSSASAARSNLSAAALGSNSDITALTGLTTDLSVAQGGTGASTHTANSVLVGAGTSAITSVAPSTSGNVLTSNGTSWASAAASSSVITLGTANSPSSVSSVTFTGIPSGTNRVEIIYAGITWGSNDLIYTQLGDSGGIETSGYLASASSYTENVEATVGFRHHNNGMSSQGAAAIIQYSRVTGNIWSMHSVSRGNLTNSAAGSKTLSGELTQLKVYSILGNDMTAGTIQISYQT